jgi:uncharacterized protein YjiS (DUF1127 family)
MDSKTMCLKAGSHDRATAQAGVARIKRSYASAEPVRGSSACNDAAYGTGRDHAAELDGWARRTAAANGFGDVHAKDAASRPGLDAISPSSGMGVARYDGPAAVVGALYDAAVDGACRRFASQARARDARASRLSVQELDSRTAHGLGLGRSAERSVAADHAANVRSTITFHPGDSPLLYKTEGMRDLFASVSHWVAGLTRRYLDAWRQYRLARNTFNALRALDARTLRDVGLDRSELDSISAEIIGRTDLTRMQALRSLRALSLY